MSLLVSGLWSTASRHRQRAAMAGDALRYSGVGHGLRHRAADYHDHLTVHEHPGPEGVAYLQELSVGLHGTVTGGLFGPVLAKMSLFRHCEEPFLQRLAGRLQLEVHMPGNVVYEHGSVGHSMYIVWNGAVALVSPSDGAMQALLTGGEAFGEAALAGHSTRSGRGRGSAGVRPHRAVAVRPSDVLVLRKWDLQDAMRDYPDSGDLVTQRVRWHTEFQEPGCGLWMASLVAGWEGEDLRSIGTRGVPMGADAQHYSSAHAMVPGAGPVPSRRGRQRLRMARLRSHGEGRMTAGIAQYGAELPSAQTEATSAGKAGTNTLAQDMAVTGIASEGSYGLQSGPWPVAEALEQQGQREELPREQRSRSGKPQQQQPERPKLRQRLREMLSIGSRAGAVLPEERQAPALHAARATQSSGIEGPHQAAATFRSLSRRLRCSTSQFPVMPPAPTRQASSRLVLRASTTATSAAGTANAGIADGRAQRHNPMLWIDSVLAEHDATGPAEVSSDVELNQAPVGEGPRRSEYALTSSMAVRASGQVYAHMLHLLASGEDYSPTTADWVAANMQPSSGATETPVLQALYTGPTRPVGPAAAAAAHSAATADAGISFTGKLATHPAFHPHHPLPGKMTPATGHGSVAEEMLPGAPHHEQAARPVSPSLAAPAGSTSLRGDRFRAASQLGHDASEWALSPATSFRTSRSGPTLQVQASVLQSAAMQQRHVTSQARRSSQDSRLGQHCRNGNGLATMSRNGVVSRLTASTYRSRATMESDSIGRSVLLTSDSAPASTWRPRVASGYEQMHGAGLFPPATGWAGSSVNWSDDSGDESRLLLQFKRRIAALETELTACQAALGQSEARMHQFLAAPLQVPALANAVAAAASERVAALRKHMDTMLQGALAALQASLFQMEDLSQQTAAADNRLQRLEQSGAAISGAGSVLGVRLEDTAAQGATDGGSARAQRGGSLSLGPRTLTPLSSPALRAQRQPEIQPTGPSFSASSLLPARTRGLSVPGLQRGPMVNPRSRLLPQGILKQPGSAQAVEVLSNEAAVILPPHPGGPGRRWSLDWGDGLHLETGGLAWTPEEQLGAPNAPTVSWLLREPSDGPALRSPRRRREEALSEGVREEATNEE